MSASRFTNRLYNGSALRSGKLFSINSIELRQSQPLQTNVNRTTFTSRNISSTATMSTKYPSTAAIGEMFGMMASGDYPAMFKNIADDVDWTVMGTHPCAGRYTSLASFQEGTLKRLSAIMKEPGIKLRVRNVIGGGDQEWAVVELLADAVCKNGLVFPNTYAWVMRFNEAGKIVQVRAYLDSTLVKQAVEENECPSQRAPPQEV